MLICQQRDCTCRQHQLVQSLSSNKRRRSKIILKKLENRDDLTNDSILELLLNDFVKYGIAEIVVYLIELGSDVNSQGSEAFTPLMQAVRDKNVDGVKILLKNGADIYLTNRDGVSNLAFACRESIFYVPYVLRKADPQRKVIVEMFFEKVNNDFSIDKHKVTQSLLNPNDTVKLASVVFGSVELIKFMLDNGYAINYSFPNSGFTALHYAIIFAKFNNAKTLIELGADINAKDNIGYKAVYYYTDLFQNVDKKSEVLNILLRDSKNLTKPNDRGMKQIEHLLLSGNEETVRTVLESDVELSAVRFQYNNSLLHVLVINKSDDVLDILVELDIQFNVNAESYGDTALMLAAGLGSVKKVKFLLEHGADVNITSVSGNSALKVAVTYNEDSHRRSSESQEKATEIIVLLLQHGANVQTVLWNNVTLLHTFIQYYENGPSIKLIIAHLVLLKLINSSALTAHTRHEIQTNQILQAHFNLCTQQLEQMKSTAMLKKITLFEILSQKEDRVAKHARNQQFILAFNTTMAKSSHLDPYYFNALQNRFAKALDIVKLQDKSACTIELLTGLCFDTYHTIVHKIIGYLNLQDLNTLSRIENVDCIQYN